MNFYQRQVGAGLMTAFILWATVDAASAAQPNAGSSAPPRPVAVWPSGPLDVVVAFDQKIDAAVAKGLVGRAIVYSDKGARPGQDAQAAGSLRIVGARLADDARSLLLATDPHPLMARYALPLYPAGAHGGRPVANSKDAGIEYDLSGVEATWTADGDPADRPRWSGWWPVLDSEATWRFTRGSKPHEECRALLSKPGRLVLSTMVRLPQGKVSLQLEGRGTVDEAALGDAQAGAPPAATQATAFDVKLAVESSGESLFFTVALRTGVKGLESTLKATNLIGEGKAAEPLERDLFVLPWAPIPTAASAAAPIAVPDLSAGDPVRGRSLFFGDQARCATCHAFGGQGGKVGPDLSEIGKKGRAEIYRAITAPSAAIAPDYTSYTVASDDGQVVAGVVRAVDANTIRITDTNARETLIARAKVQQIRPSATSIMPPGLTGALGDSAVRDIIAFLVDPPARANQHGTPTPANVR
jgi:putative heme-binding domain-containing protein